MGRKKQRGGRRELHRWRAAAVAGCWMAFAIFGCWRIRAQDAAPAPAAAPAVPAVPAPPAAADPAAAPPVNTEDSVRQILRARVEDDKRAVGLAVGWIDAAGSHLAAYGRTSLADGREVDGRTLFEIGSVTKVFTATLLAEAVTRRQVALRDPVARYLPAEVKVPASGLRPITLLDLATHHSGLPSFPENFQPRDSANPYADLGVEQLYAFVSAARLGSEVGARYDYSNLGFALLGQALANRAQCDFETLVAEGVCQPLGLADTAVTLTPAQRKRAAAPHDQGLKPAANWDLGAFAPAGGLHSDAEDLLKFIAANLAEKGPLAAALALTHEVRSSAGGAATDIALGWHVNRVHVPPIYWQNGGTGGYRSFVGFDLLNRTGVVVLGNTANSVDDIGFRLLNPRFELAPQARQKAAAALRPESVDPLLGKYAVSPQFVMAFSREGSRYFLQATGQPRLEVYPESELDFFATAVDAAVTFVKDADGSVNALVLHQRGIPDQTAKREK